MGRTNGIKLVDRNLRKTIVVQQPKREAEAIQRGGKAPLGKGEKHLSKSGWQYPQTNKQTIKGPKGSFCSMTPCSFW